MFRMETCKRRLFGPTSRVGGKRKQVFRDNLMRFKEGGEL